MRRIPAWMDAAVRLVVSLAALAAILGVLDGALYFDAAANFAPLYVALGLAGLVWGAIARRPGVVGLALVASAAGAWLMTAELTRDVGPVAAAAAPNQLKVIQVNILRTNSDKQRLADWIDAEHPDLVTMTEARVDLRDLLKRRGWKVANQHGDLMIFSRERYLVMNRPRLRHEAMVNYVNATYATTSGPAEVATAHLRWPIDPLVGPALRDLPLVAAQIRSDRTILTGDLNATPWSHELRALDRQVGLIRRDRALPTWPAKVFGLRWPWPFLPIDHVYAGRGWATVSIARGPYIGSDHYPLIVVLAPVASDRPRASAAGD